MISGVDEADDAGEADDDVDEADDDADSDADDGITVEDAEDEERAEEGIWEEGFALGL